MINREKVTKGLECCGGTGMCFHGCPYHEVSPSVEGCTSQLAAEALESLKEQDAEIERLEHDLAVAQNNLKYYVNGNGRRNIMVIEVIPHGAIPFMCKRCMTVYLWKPSIVDEFCKVRAGHQECTIQECRYYEADVEEVQCPVCKTRHNQKQIGSFQYKLTRAFSKRVERGDDIG